MKKDSKKNDVLKAFEKFGFNVVKESEHIKMRNEQGQTVSIPNHKRIKGSTLSQICRTAGIDKVRFFNLV